MLTKPTRPPSRAVRLRDLDPDDIANWLEQLTPHLGDDETLPFLTAVHILLAGGAVHGYATDRYTGALATLPYARVEQDALVTIPGDFAKRAIEWLRREGLDYDEEMGVSLDLTLTGRILGLTMHLIRRVYVFEDRRHGPGYRHEPYTVRLAGRTDAHDEAIDFPKIAAGILTEPEVTGPVHISAPLLARFTGYGPVVRIEPTTGHLLDRTTEDQFAGYRIYSTGRIVVFTRDHYFAILATCRTAEKNAARNTEPAARESWRETSETSTREHWGTTLATLTA